MESNKKSIVREKKTMMNDNILLCNYKELKTVPIYKTLKHKYNSTFEFPENQNICSIEIMTSDIMTIAQHLTINGKSNPVIVHMVDKTFEGDPNELIDHIQNTDLVLRTNFYKSTYNLYPLKDGEITYSQVLVFRNETHELIKNTYNISVITFSPTKNPHLINSNMNSHDYIIYQQNIESIFQGAYLMKHDSVILSDLGCINYGIPVDDVIEILNICVLKYCSLFKFIIICIQPKSHIDMNIVSKMTKDIIRPQTFFEVGLH